MKTEQIPGAITVTINETDLISREFDDCFDCSLCCAIQRETGKVAFVTTGIAKLYSCEKDRSMMYNGVYYKLQPVFDIEDYNALRKRAMNREKVFHKITLIPV